MEQICTSPYPAENNQGFSIPILILMQKFSVKTETDLNNIHLNKFICNS